MFFQPVVLVPKGTPKCLPKVSYSDCEFYFFSAISSQSFKNASGSRLGFGLIKKNRRLLKRCIIADFELRCHYENIIINIRTLNVAYLYSIIIV